MRAREWALAIQTVVIVAAMLVAIRISLVSREKVQILSEMSEISTKEIRNGEYENWKWRLDVYASVSFEEMALKFWKPVDSFYPPVSEWQKPNQEAAQRAE